MLIKPLNARSQLVRIEKFERKKKSRWRMFSFQSFILRFIALHVKRLLWFTMEQVWMTWSFYLMFVVYKLVASIMRVFIPHTPRCVCVYAAIVWLNSCSNNRPENVCFNANRANNASLASQCKIRMIKSMWKMSVFFLCEHSEHLLFCERPNTDPEKETHSFITSVDKRVVVSVWNRFHNS